MLVKKAENIKVKVLGIAVADHFPLVARKLDIDAYIPILPIYQLLPLTLLIFSLIQMWRPLREDEKCFSVIMPSYLITGIIYTA